MVMVKLTSKDIEEGTENYCKALTDATNSYLNDWTDMDIELSRILKITGMSNKTTHLAIDLPFEEGWLISLATDLDYCCYDSTTELWNNIVKDEDLISQYNMTDIYDESLLFLFGELEDEIMSLDLDNNTDLTKEIDVNIFIEKYEYRDLIEVDELKEAMDKALKELQQIIDSNLKEYFQSDEYYNMIDEIEFYQIDYYWEEINKNGFVEVYI